MRMLAACLKKKAYSSFTVARMVAERRSAATELVIIAYACDAGHYHIGKQGTGA